MKPEVLQLSHLLKKLPPRAKAANKSDFGTVLILAGDQGMSGAARICAEGCMRVGAGLVTLATHPAHAATATLLRPELICHGIDKPLQLAAHLEKATVLAVGPGLTQSACSQELTQSVLSSHLPTVIDGGALDSIKALHGRHSHWIMTPHPGEAGRLLDSSASAVQADRIGAITELQQRYGGIVVLKGADTLVKCKDSLYICHAGNPGMASAGMGDLLTGIVTGLLAQGLSSIDSANLGVILHATAGDNATDTEGLQGLLALDLIPYIRNLLNPDFI